MRLSKLNNRESAIMLLTQVYWQSSFFRSTGLICTDAEKLTMWSNLMKINGVKLTIKEKDEVYTEVYSEMGKFQKASLWVNKHGIDLFKEMN